MEQAHCIILMEKKKRVLGKMTRKSLKVFCTLDFLEAAPTEKPKEESKKADDGIIIPHY